ncbi:methyltransferase domain-containing protein [Actinocorallia aurantiaca]|uniref:methyltransferase domain-containing protein n=1 Tax=Actinocorallia aurantiaca TaxID=46204 RepID=UPI003CD0921F
MGVPAGRTGPTTSLCRLCGGTVEEYLDLGRQPISQSCDRTVSGGGGTGPGERPRTCAGVGFYARGKASGRDQGCLRRGRRAGAGTGNPRAADVGCGPGHLTAMLHDPGLDAFGLDLFPGMLDHARCRADLARSA